MSSPKPITQYVAAAHALMIARTHLDEAPTQGDVLAHHEQCQQALARAWEQLPQKYQTIIQPPDYYT